MSKIFLLPLLTILITILAVFVVRILKSDPHLYELNRTRFRYPFDVFFGRAKAATMTPIADGGAHRGLVHDSATGKLEIQGALSREAIDRIVAE